MGLPGVVVSPVLPPGKNTQGSASPTLALRVRNAPGEGVLEQLPAAAGQQHSGQSGWLICVIILSI